MLPALHGKSVLVGVTGSISAYKACEVARLFVKAGAEVYVVMTAAAERFVSALTFEALTRNPVLTETSESWSSTLNHIETGKKCDIFLITPATANTINKFAQGIADNILTQTALAFQGKLIIAPAANTHMLYHSATAASLHTLKERGVEIVTPQEKKLACGDKGEGALAEPEEIFFAGAKALLKERHWDKRPVVVTGGGTREKIDEVRYLSNYSSGKMAKSLVLSLYLKGAQVTYITTKEGEGLPSSVNVIDTEDTESMFTHTQVALKLAKNRQSCTIENPNQKRPYLFMVAAVSDYTPAEPQSGKLKKSTLGKTWSLNLEQTTDILSTLDKEGITTVAFKAEMDSETGLENARNLLKTKKVDAVCYNLLADSTSFGTDRNEIRFITAKGDTPLPENDKLTLSNDILRKAEKLTDE